MSNAKQPDYFVKIGAPAQRALQNKGIQSVQDLAKYSKAEILKLHGMGPSTIPKLAAVLEENGLSFRQTK